MFAFIDTIALSEKGAWVHLRQKKKKAYLHDDQGNPDLSKPIRIKIYGPDSPTLQAKARARAAQITKERADLGEIGDLSEKVIEGLLEEKQALLPQTWADATMGWENMPEGLVFSEEEALKLYEGYPDITRQLIKEGQDMDDFLELVEDT